MLQQKKRILTPGEMEQVILPKSWFNAHPLVKTITIQLKRSDDMAEIKNLICVSCPMGCRLEVTVDGQGSIERLGQSMRSAALSMPKKKSSTRRACSRRFCRCAAARKTWFRSRRKPIFPNRCFANASRRLKGFVVDAPIHSGDVIIANLCGTNVALIATKTVGKKG
ncbi:MAG: DUF1667 domain-containing protein [Bacillus subtilis]|nr:DUF1667 domain-containing protein [Bacillus subtilis]